MESIAFVFVYTKLWTNGVVTRGQHNTRVQRHLRIAGRGQLFRLISSLISMSMLLTDVADLAGYAEPEVTAQMELNIFHITCKLSGLW